MAGGMELGTKTKGKRSLDAALNLVPFIDLMAVTIVFLIMSAVWTQLGSLHASAAPPSGPPLTSPDERPVTVLFTLKTLTLQVGGSVIATLPVSRDDRGKLLLAELGRHLDELKAQLPDQASVSLNTEDAVAYEDLVRVMDTCIASRFPAVTVEAASD